MTGIDLFFLVAYFLVVGGIGYWSSTRSLKDTKSYFLGGSSIGWMAIGASLFASNISSEHFIGLAGSGAEGGLAIGQFEWLACLILLILGWVFVPFYIRTGVFTMPEFLEKRFSPQCRTYLSAVSLIAYVFTKVSVAIYAGATLLHVIAGWNIWLSAFVLVVATGVYTIFGGLRAVIYTDFFQAFVLVGGAVFLTATAISKVGGLQQMFAQVNPEYFNLWKPLSHPELPWTGILFGAPILGIWYWCTDQMIVQRTLAAHDIADARKATIFAGFLKILPVFILVLPGIAGMLLFPNVKPDEMYATMVNNLLPPGIKGLVVAGLMAALMSSLSSVFNSSSTLVVIDFYKKMRPEASEKELVRAGQVSTVVLVVIGVLWIPFIGVMSNQLYLYLQSVQAYVSPPIAAVFLLGITWKRLNEKGALAALLGGFVLGAARFITELGVKGKWIAGPQFLIKFATINFLHFAIILFVFSVIILVGVSYATKPPSKEKLDIFQPHPEIDKKVAESHESYDLNAVLSLLLTGIVLTLWLIFSPFFFR